MHVKVNLGALVMMSDTFVIGLHLEICEQNSVILSRAVVSITSSSVEICLNDRYLHKGSYKKNQKSDAYFLSCWSAKMVLACV